MNEHSRDSQSIELTLVTETGKLWEKQLKEMNRADFTTCPQAISVFSHIE